MYEAIIAGLIVLGVSIILGIIGFFIKRKFFKDKKNITNINKKAGVLYTGKGSVFQDCKIEGPDVGLIDCGDDLTVINSKMKATGKIVSQAGRDINIKQEQTNKRPLINLYLRRPNQGSNYNLRLRNIGDDNALSVNIEPIKYEDISGDIMIRMEIEEKHLIPQQEITIKFWAEDSEGNEIAPERHYEGKFDYLPHFGKQDFKISVNYSNLQGNKYHNDFIVKPNLKVESDF